MSGGFTDGAAVTTSPVGLGYEQTWVPFLTIFVKVVPLARS